MIELKKIGYLTAREAAKYLGISERTLYNWKDKGLLSKPALSQNGMVIWKISDMNKTLKKMGKEQPYNGNK